MGGASIVGIIGLAISAFGTASQMSSAKKAEQQAKKQERAQKAQIDAQEKQDELNAQIAQRKAVRASRVASAQTVSQTGGLVGGSVVTDPLVSQQSSLAGYLDVMSQQGELRSQQYNISREQAGIKADIAINEAESAIWKSITGFAEQAVEGIGDMGVNEGWWD